jgi:hypothetical protein
MRAPVTLAASLALTCTLASVPVAAQFWKPTPGLTVWADADYKGANTTFTADTPDISGTGLARLISSLRVGQGETWEVCTEPHYAGRCRRFTSGVPNLQTVQLNDLIMSVRRVSKPEAAPAGPGNAVPPPIPSLPPATGLELYAGVNYSGRRLTLADETPNFRQKDFNDRVMSLRVPRNQTWEICINNDYDDCRAISGDVPDLAAIGFSRNISSARPRSGYGGGRRAQIVFYDSTDFRGRSVTIDDDRPSFDSTSGATGSVRVVGGEWQVCDRPRYFGNCVVVRNDVRDLSRVGLRGVESLRRNQDR